MKGVFVIALLVLLVAPLSVDALTSPRTYPKAEAPSRGLKFCNTSNDCAVSTGKSSICDPVPFSDGVANVCVACGLSEPGAPSCSAPAVCKAGVCEAPSLTQPGGDGSQTQSTGGTLVNPLNAKTIQELLAIVLKGIVQIGSIIIVLALVWVGFLFVFAQGNEEKVKSARAALMWTVVGGLVLLGAQGIAMVLQSTVDAL